MTTPTKTRAFLVEETHKNIDTVSEHGIPEVLFGNNRRRASVFQTDRFMEDIEGELVQRNFDPDMDLFVLSGSLIATSLALCAVLRHWHRVNVLIFSASESRYVRTTISGDSTCPNSTNN